MLLEIFPMGTTDIMLGMYVLYEGQPHVVIDKEFYSPAKGASFTKTKLRNLNTGKIISTVYKSVERPEEISVDNQTMQYLYNDGNKAFLMNPNTFEQVEVSINLIPGGTDFLHIDGKYIATIYNDKILSIQIPVKMTLEVTDTTDAVKGNTATNASKDAILETGAKVQVPLFINRGDRITINTDDRSYVAKA